MCFSSSCSWTVLPVSQQQGFVISLCKLYDLSSAGRTTHTWWVTQCFCLFNGNKLSSWVIVLLACCFLSCQCRLFSYYTNSTTYWIQLHFPWNTLSPGEVCDSLLIYLSDPLLSCAWKKKWWENGGACALQISRMWGYVFRNNIRYVTFTLYNHKPFKTFQTKFSPNLTWMLCS